MDIAYPDEGFPGVLLKLGSAVEGGVGRAAIAPEILLSLWLYATLDGVGSGREASRLTQAHDAYRWLCGGLHLRYKL